MRVRKPTRSNNPTLVKQVTWDYYCCYTDCMRERWTANRYIHTRKAIQASYTPYLDSLTDVDREVIYATAMAYFDAVNNPSVLIWLVGHENRCNRRYVSREACLLHTGKEATHAAHFWAHDSQLLFDQWLELPLNPWDCIIQKTATADENRIDLNEYLKRKER